MTDRKLDIENIGRIGQMFLNADILGNILVDRFTCDDDDTDYNIEVFNELKITLMKIERLNPDIYITGAVWYWYPANKKMAAPVIAGRAQAAVGWVISPCNEALYKCMSEDVNTSTAMPEGKTVHYFPLRDSNCDVIGALELTEGAEYGMFEKHYNS